ncbi:MAG: hypothetical protein A4S09_05005 [Proteobacteria bacterium SG_bin7]|nr:MAG: hypothetical protein A4S09_05005 [Proteobacteria bacterium SG_bin7]
MKKKITKDEFLRMTMDRAEKLTRKEHGLREESHLSSQHWYYRNGAYAMAVELLKEQYEVVDESQTNR